MADPVPVPSSPRPPGRLSSPAPRFLGDADEFTREVRRRALEEMLDAADGLRRTSDFAREAARFYGEVAMELRRINAAAAAR